jgi:hypothetical protein
MIAIAGKIGDGHIHIRSAVDPALSMSLADMAIGFPMRSRGHSKSYTHHGRPIEPPISLRRLPRDNHWHADALLLDGRPACFARRSINGAQRRSLH